MTPALSHVLFVQGAGPGAHAADQVLADALQAASGAAVRVHFPTLPGEADPDATAWKRAIARAWRATGASRLVAHSAGAAVVADLLVDDATSLAGLRGAILLAPPFVGRGGWTLSGFHLDGAVAAPAGLHLVFGGADATVPAAHAELYAPVFPSATFHRWPGCDHQFGGFMARVARLLSTI